MQVSHIKSCSACHKDLPMEAFSLKRASRDGRQSSCKDCQKSVSAAHYAANSDRAAERNRSNRENMRKLIDSLKDVPCADCRGRFPAVCMDFDHQGDKEFNLGDVLRRRLSKQRVHDEIAKCEVVCSNCHRIRSSETVWR